MGGYSYRDMNAVENDRCGHRIISSYQGILVIRVPVIEVLLYVIQSIFIVSLRKHAYSNILKISPPKKKNENFQIKNSDIFQISAHNIDYWYSLEPPQRGGSNEYPQSMFLSRNKKNNVYSCKPQFYYIKGGLKWGKRYKVCFRDVV